jgi:hypothetical protein
MKALFNQLIPIVVFAAGAITSFCANGQSTLIDPTKMQRIGTVDERFQSYNVEMLEVTGGKFWKPYSSLAKQTAKPAEASGSSTPTGMDPNLYEYRAPLNLANPRLRKMALALGPAYVRVSGTWANTTYFQDKPGPAPETPPAGFETAFSPRNNGKALSILQEPPMPRLSPHSPQTLVCVTVQVCGHRLKQINSLPIPARPEERSLQRNT